MGYEALRSAVVCGQPEGWRLGHGVLARQGMAGWMATWAAITSPAAGTTAPNPAAPSTPCQPDPSPAARPALSSVHNAGEIVAVLTQMTLAHL